jgi:PTS system mannose-specific IIA component
MIGVVLATHGRVAPAMLEAAEAIVGPMDQVAALSLEAGVSPETMRVQVAEAVRTVDEGDGVLVLCDMFGGTPSNVCLSTDCEARIEVVTGVNLPMLLKLATARSQGLLLEEAASQIAAYGQRHIAHATAMLRQRREPGPRPAAHADGHAG